MSRQLRAGAGLQRAGMGREGKAWMPEMQEWTSGLGTGMIWGWCWGSGRKENHSTRCVGDRAMRNGSVRGRGLEREGWSRKGTRHSLSSTRVQITLTPKVELRFAEVNIE